MRDGSWPNYGLNIACLVLGVVPVFVTAGTLHVAGRWLPPNFYMFVGAFLRVAAGDDRNRALRLRGGDLEYPAAGHGGPCRNRRRSSRIRCSGLSSSICCPNCGTMRRQRRARNACGDGAGPDSASRRRQYAGIDARSNGRSSRFLYAIRGWRAAPLRA